MQTTKVAISIDRHLLEQLDALVARRVYPSRSRAIQEAVRDKLERVERTRLARECAKLERAAEQALADEGIAQELATWPAY